ncbi:MAG: Asp-tRNA(Asn)/Glu-tRNA(Gln) amidotransferase subunit GatC [Microbacterium sp.]
MPSFDSDEVARVAALARIELTPVEIERLAGELEVITRAVESVSEIATPDVPPTSHPLPLTNVFRTDEPAAGLDIDEVLAAAPASEDNQFLVPQILGEDA